MGTPHDALFRSTFGSTAHAAGLFRFLLPRALTSAVDWSSLQACPTATAGPDLRLHHADQLFEANVRGSTAPVVLLLEHKAGRDDALVRQLVRYVVHVTGASVQTSGAVPHVVPVVVHHGQRPLPRPSWVGTADRRIEAPAIAELASFQPRIRFVLDDLAHSSEAAIRARPLTALGKLTLLFLAFLPSAAVEEVVAALLRWAKLLQMVAGGAGGSLTIESLSSYVLQATELPAERLTATVVEILGTRSEEWVMSTADKLIAKGRAEGHAQGKVELLLRQLEVRFGTLDDEARERLRSASRDDVDRWAVRVLDAKTIDDVFAA